MEETELDIYINQASEPTKPIIVHLRKLIKTACPEIEENIKWKAPSFELGGKIVCSVMAFKKHVNFIFTQGKSMQDNENVLEDVGGKSNMRGIKQITDIADLPNAEILIAYIKEAVALTKG